MLESEKWLLEGGFKEEVAALDCETLLGFGYPLAVVMERYANSKSMNFQASILNYRNTLTEEQKISYDLHFGIVKQTQGKI